LEAVAELHKLAASSKAAPKVHQTLPCFMWPTLHLAWMLLENAQLTILKGCGRRFSISPCSVLRLLLPLRPRP
jgi:hypothetical protein